MLNSEIRKRGNFNCMGYALGVNEWLHPHKEASKWFGMPSGAIREEKMPEIGKYLEENWNLREISSAEVDKHEGKVIAFRIAEGDDFHFMVRKGRNWFHKRGGLPTFERVKKEVVFGKIWRFGSINYNSKIMFFVEK